VRLSHRDFDALQRTILARYAYPDGEAFREAIPDLFLKLIPADYFLLYDADVDMAARTTKVVDSWESVPQNPGLAVHMERIGFDHPFTVYSLRTSDPSPLKLSDFFTLTQFRSSWLYSELYRHMNCERLLAVASPRAAGITAINSVRLRGSKDFTERDRLVMHLLHPHFDQARLNAERVDSRGPARPLEGYGLSRRETEVARWLAEGKTNPEIAMILHSQTRTIEKHVERILSKLAVENRTAAAILIAASHGTHRDA
jgi:DNA-binding CsgD family transcriptional regulator